MLRGDNYGWGEPFVDGGQSGGYVRDGHCPASHEQLGRIGEFWRCQVANGEDRKFRIHHLRLSIAWRQRGESLFERGLRRLNRRFDF
jgi:hypothetical protein